MNVYVDMCALKRPFDDQSHDRIWLETQAVMQILKWFRQGRMGLVNSEALVIENGRNPKAVRKFRVASLLRLFGSPLPASGDVKLRAYELRSKGLGDMDALHLALAESAHASHFVTTDDALLEEAQRMANVLGTKVVNPIDFAKEFGQ